VCWSKETPYEIRMVHRVYASQVLHQHLQQQQLLQGGIDGAGVAPTSAALQPLTPLATSILEGIAVLDDWGAWEWNLRFVAVLTAGALWLVRRALGKKRGVDWYAFVHAVLTATGSLACVYLDVASSESFEPHVPEPLRSCRCSGPLTSLHRILPAITMGYSLFDFLDGITISVDFALHGSATLFVMAFYCEIGAPHFITPMLLMEVSTVFLTVVRADFFTERMAMANQLLFALNFFLFRLVVVPLVWLKHIVVMAEERTSDTFRECFPPYFFPVSLVFGVFFHLLNAYWFVKIAKKARRKITGIEPVKADNDIYDRDVVNGSAEKRLQENNDKARKAD